jgi:hypothetical protein
MEFAQRSVFELLKGVAWFLDTKFASIWVATDNFLVGNENLCLGFNSWKRTNA